MLKQLCGECEEVIESLADGWDDAIDEHFVCTACKDWRIENGYADPGRYTPMKDVIT
jgi:hypothetical protein